MYSDDPCRDATVSIPTRSIPARTRCQDLAQVAFPGSGFAITKTFSNDFCCCFLTIPDEFDCVKEISPHCYENDFSSICHRYHCPVGTIREVAALSGTSIGTVSRALNGGTGVSEQTRTRIEDAARTLGYRSNAMARGLRRNSSNTIGLLIPDFEKHDYTTGTALLHDVLRAAGYQLLLCCHNDDPVLDAEALLRLADFRVDGIIHSPCSIGGAAQVLGEASAIPVVEFFRRSQSTAVDAVTSDGELVSYELTNHFIDSNHRRIALLTGQLHLSTSTQRIAGFARALDEADLDPELCPVLCEEPTADWCADAVAALLGLPEQERPTAIFAASTHIALGVLEQLDRAHVAIPAEMSVVAFSSAEWLAVSRPPLTAYEIPLREMGLMAGQLLLNRLQAKPNTNLRPQIVSFSGRIVERSSTSVLPLTKVKQ